MADIKFKYKTTNYLFDLLCSPYLLLPFPEYKLNPKSFLLINDMELKLMYKKQKQNGIFIFIYFLNLIWETESRKET